MLCLEHTMLNISTKTIGWTTEEPCFDSREGQKFSSQKRVDSYFLNIPTHTHNIYTLKSTKIHIKTLKNLPLHVSVPFSSHLQAARGQYFVKLPS